MIYYEDFGARGDGKTNDFLAMQAAHKRANETGEDVFATPGKCYYINELNGEPITIKTNTSWQGAKIIIDDTYLSGGNPETYPKCEIFSVENDYPTLFLDETNPYIAALNENRPVIKKNGETKRLDLGLGYPAFLMVYNDENTQYKRAGFVDRGAPQKELIVIDECGNIDEKTPVLFDYEKITRIEVVRIDTKPITIEGGEITTLASRVHNEKGGYREVAHGLLVSRPNTTVKGVKHYIENQLAKGEIINGVPFYGDSVGGFFKTSFTSNVEFRDCFATGRVMYGASYEIILSHSNDVRLVNVKQSEENYNRIKDWWIMGSNFCKNISYDGCYLTRFDAHCGVYNVTIKNSTVASLRLTGGGDFVIENSTVKTKIYGGDTFIMLREDYGSTWRGNIYIKNCVFDSIFDDRKYETVTLIWAEWRNHDFGYKTYMPNVYVDNLSFAEKLGTKCVELFDITNRDENYPNVISYSEAFISGDENKNVYTPPKLVSIKNCDTGVDFLLADSEFLKDTELYYEK